MKKFWEKLKVRWGISSDWQVAIILLAYLVLGYWFRRRLANEQQYRQIVIIPGSLFIALIGLYWTYDRIVL